MKDPPNLELLIKLMKMTTSSTDGEALNAIRMANAALQRAGGDWEVLLRGKLAPIDPFASLAQPARVQPGARPQPTAPRPPPPPPPPTYYGLSKKEAKDIANWIVIVEFGAMTTYTNNLISGVVSRWTARSRLDANDYQLLRRTAEAIKKGIVP